MSDTEKRSRMSEWLMHLLGHASWRVIEWILAVLFAAAMASLLLFTQWLRHHWDVLTIVTVFFASVVSFFLIGWAQGRQTNRELKAVAPSFSADNVLIFSNGPTLFLYPLRSHADIQMTIWSSARVELLYVEAKVICDSTEVTVIESSRPVTVPPLNPQNQILGKSLTETELKRFDLRPGTFFNIAGYARFKGPDGTDFSKTFAFYTAALWSPPVATGANF